MIGSPIYVDRREQLNGLQRQKNLLEPLKQHSPTNQFIETTLPFGDVSWVWKGPQDSIIPVGVEIKTIHDAVACMRDGRFAGTQLPGLRRLYSVVYLVIIGTWRENNKGELVTPRGRSWVPYDMNHDNGHKTILRYQHFQAWLTSFRVQGRIIVVDKIADEKELVSFLMAEYEWGQIRWESHTSIHQFDRSGSDELDEVDLTPASLVRQWAKELPGVGWKKSAEAQGKFPTPYALAQSTEKDWLEIKGIGKTLAKKIVSAIRGTE